MRNLTCIVKNSRIFLLAHFYIVQNDNLTITFASILQRFAIFSQYGISKKSRIIRVFWIIYKWTVKLTVRESKRKQAYKRFDLETVTLFAPGSNDRCVGAAPPKSREASLPVLPYSAYHLTIL